MKGKWLNSLCLTVMATLLLSLNSVLPAKASDARVANHSFESDLSGWTQSFGSGGIIASTEQAHTGTKSAKITDTSSTLQYGIETAKMSASPGTEYIAFSRVYVASGSANLYIRFWNSANAVVGTSFTSLSSPQNQWSVIQHSASAPANAVFVSVLLYSSAPNMGTTYWDDVLVTKKTTDLGVQVTNASPNSATFGIGASQDKIYAVIPGSSGNDAAMAVIDADTGTALHTYSMPGASGGWGATTASDGKVYLGSHVNGRLYQYVPGASSVTDAGIALSGETYIFSLTSGTGGRVYGGTYGNAGFFRYTPSQGFLQIGSKPIWSGKQYTRSIAYDAATNVTYLGLGTNAALIRLDNDTGAKQDILPPQYAGESFVYSLDYTGGRLFAKLTPSNTLLVFNIVENTGGSITTTLEKEILNVDSLFVSPAKNGLVYFTKDNFLYSYNITTKAESALGKNMTFASSRMGWITLDDQANYPGETLVSIGGGGGKTRISKYNPTNGTIHASDVGGLQEVPTNINTIGSGPDGSIYSGGFLTGGTGIYSPMRGDSNDSLPDLQYKGLSQTESILSYGNKLYIAVYPGARLYEYDPAQGWDTDLNPVKKLDLKSYGQDRPVVMTSGGGKLYIGSVAAYGRLDGALTEYDPATGTALVKRNIVANQSITALAYANGKVYGGTSIKGGLGIVPTQTEAKLFVYDPATGTKAGEYSLPVAGLQAITALHYADNKIWGFAEGYLFVFDPAANTFEYFTEKFAEVGYTDGTWKDAKLLTVSKDNTHIYGTIHNKYLFKINKSNKTVTNLVSSGANGLAADEYGNLYYKYQTKLWRYALQ